MKLTDNELYDASSGACPKCDGRVESYDSTIREAFGGVWYANMIFYRCKNCGAEFYITFKPIIGHYGNPESLIPRPC